METPVHLARTTGVTGIRTARSSAACACHSFGKRTGRRNMKPFAVQLYERFTRGETSEQLAAALQIPVERVALRLRAAEIHLAKRQSSTARLCILTGRNPVRRSDSK